MHASLVPTLLSGNACVKLNAPTQESWSETESWSEGTRKKDIILNGQKQIQNTRTDLSSFHHLHGITLDTDFYPSLVPTLRVGMHTRRQKGPGALQLRRVGVRE